MMIRSFVFLVFCSAATITTVVAQTLPTISGTRVPCLNGKADQHACHAVDLLARVSIDDLYAYKTGVSPAPDYALLNDIWGWTDPLTGREYALVGRHDAVAFVDVTNPMEPIYMGFLPSHGDAASVWRDMKVYKDHMFVVVDANGSNGMQIFDLTELRNFQGGISRFSHSARYIGIETAHNVAINEETGFAYIVGGRPECRGLHMVDISSPLEPQFVGCFSHPGTGRSNNGYTHDTQCVVYKGPDTDHFGQEICFSSNERALSIVDVTDKSAPIPLAAASYPGVGYTHQGWLTEDHRYFVMNDEMDERNFVDRTRTLIWDVTDVEDPVLAQEFLGRTGSIDHNLYVRDQYVFASNYTSGLSIIDVEDPLNPFEVAYFDTHPSSDRLGFSGTWSVYPFFASGTIVVNSHPDGLLILDPSQLNISRLSSTQEAEEQPEGLTLTSAYPNPFNPSTTFSVLVHEDTRVTVNVFDMLGRHVERLVDGPVAAGSHVITLDGSSLPSGTYIVHARAGLQTATQHVTLIK